MSLKRKFFQSFTQMKIKTKRPRRWKANSHSEAPFSERRNSLIGLKSFSFSLSVCPMPFIKLTYLWGPYEAIFIRREINSFSLWKVMENMRAFPAAENFSVQRGRRKVVELNMRRIFLEILWNSRRVSKCFKLFNKTNFQQKLLNKSSEINVA